MNSSNSSKLLLLQLRQGIEKLKNRNLTFGCAENLQPSRSQVTCCAVCCASSSSLGNALSHVSHIGLTVVRTAGFGTVMPCLEPLAWPRPRNPCSLPRPLPLPRCILGPGKPGIDKKIAKQINVCFGEVTNFGNQQCKCLLRLAVKWKLKVYQYIYTISRTQICNLNEMLEIT